MLVELRRRMSCKLVVDWLSLVGAWLSSRLVGAWLSLGCQVAWLALGCHELSINLKINNIFCILKYTTNHNKQQSPTILKYKIYT